MSAAKKLEDDSLAEPVELPTERELKLSKNFEDPSLEELVPGMGSQPQALSLVEETAEAVQELAQEAGVIDLGDAFGAPEGLAELPMPEETSAAASQLPPDAVEESPSIIAFEGQGEQSGQISLMYAMAEELFQLVACERSFDALMEGVLMAVMHGVDAQAGSVLELDHEREDFFFRASTGGSPIAKLKAFRVPLTKGIVGHVAESGQALLIRDLAADQMQMRAISLSLGFDALTCMAAPILVGGQPYGVIEVFNRRDGGHFDEKDLRALEDGVRMLSKVLEVRFLLADLSRRLR